MVSVCRMEPKFKSGEKRRRKKKRKIKPTARKKKSNDRTRTAHGRAKTHERACGGTLERALRQLHHFCHPYANRGGRLPGVYHSDFSCDLLGLPTHCRRHRQ